MSPYDVDLYDLTISMKIESLTDLYRKALYGRLCSWFRAAWEQAHLFVWQHFFLNLLQLRPGITSAPQLSLTNQWEIDVITAILQVSHVLSPTVVACLCDLIDSCTDAHAHVFWAPFVPTLSAEARSSQLHSVIPRQQDQRGQSFLPTVWDYKTDVAREFRHPFLIPAEAARLSRETWESVRHIFRLPEWRQGECRPVDVPVNEYLRNYLYVSGLLNAPAYGDTYPATSYTPPLPVVPERRVQPSSSTPQESAVQPTVSESRSESPPSSPQPQTADRIVLPLQLSPGN